MRETPVAFSLPQRLVHWAMAGLIVFNLLLPDGMNEWAHLLRQGQVPTPEQVASANIHAYVGIAVLALAVLRLALRFVQGAPAEPEAEPAVLKLAAKIGHGAFYLLFFALPFSGIARYYFGSETAGFVHSGPLKALMWALIGLHVGAAVMQQFYWKTGIMKRMTSG